MMTNLVNQVKSPKLCSGTSLKWTLWDQTFLATFRGFPLSEVKNVLVTPVGTKIFVLIISIESLIWRVCNKRFHYIYRIAQFIDGGKY